jgi:hypothetical protein
MAGEQFFLFLLLIAGAWSIAFFLWVLFALWRESRSDGTHQQVSSGLQSARLRIETGWGVSSPARNDLRTSVPPSPR